MQPENLAKNGFSLIELLISLAIFSFALLGLTQLSVKAMLMSHSAYLASVANQQVFTAAELIRTHHSAENLAREVAEHLPAGQLHMSKDKSLNLITLSWYDKYHESTSQLSLDTVKLILYEKPI